MQDTYMERRKDERVRLNNEAKFRIIGDVSTESISYAYEKALTKNISKGGICLELSKKMAEGSVIRVEIPFNENRVIKAFCEVEWCRLTDSAGRYEVGMSFIALKEEDAEFLDNYIKNTKRVF